MATSNVLYAEDDPNDVFILQMAFKRAALPHSLHVVEDGKEAIDWLSGEGKYADRDKFPLPQILILDLKMPRKTGFDVLEWVRNNPDLKSMSILVLSSSDDPRDVTRASELGAVKYFVKTHSNQEVIQFLRNS